MVKQTVKSDESLVEIRCNNTIYNAYGTPYICNRLLAKLPKDSEYQIKCPKCGHINEKEKTNGR